MREFIENLITKTKQRYKDDYSYMLSDYNQEQETAKGYNGRQLLELLQNCDDQSCKTVNIELNTKEQHITISNDGKPFSNFGYRSMFIPYLSSKSSSNKYIGNKGLGFRSITTWCKALEIHSNGIVLMYSENQRKDNLKELYSDSQLKDIREKENLSNSALPIPFLTLPKIKDNKDEKYITSIKIKYKSKYLKDIKKQIDSITPETILFLKHIEKIEFNGIRNKDLITCNRSKLRRIKSGFCPTSYISFNQSSWYIFEKEDKLPYELSNTTKKDKEIYQIKIAIEKDFKFSNPYLYSFFPTKIRLEQPYILHATFDLDATRNQINDSEKNKFILKQIVDFTVKVSKYYTNANVSYKPLRILNHKHKADSLLNMGYYDFIDNAINTEAIFPCIDNTYKTMKECLYVCNDFAKMLHNINAGQLLSNHLIPHDENLFSLIYKYRINSNLSILPNVINILNEISNLTLSNHQRAEYIYQLVKNASFIKNKFNDDISLLTDENNELIIGSEYILTPLKRSNKLITPSYAEIKFINKDLYLELLNKFMFYSSDIKDEGKILTEKLDGFCHLHNYESTTLAKKIVSETNRQLTTDLENTTNNLAVIREMNECLYYNFRKNKNISRNVFSNISVPLLSQDGSITYARNLVLSKDYPLGVNTEFIFRGIYTEKDFICNYSFLGIDKYQDDVIEYEKYLLWLGVNQYAKYFLKDKVTKNINYYVNYVLKENNKHEYSKYSISYYSIDKLKYILQNISLENLISWIYLDDKLAISLDNSRNEDSFSYFYYTNKKINVKTSFLKYIIIKNYKFDFKNYLIDDRYSWVNTEPINYTNELFRRLDITKTEINEILIKLGATDDFFKLSLKRVENILNLLPIVYPSGRKSQIIYKKAFMFYQLHQKKMNKNTLLFANNGNELKLYSPKDIYFSDQISIPKQLYKHYPIFNFKSKSKGNEIIKSFGINDLKSINFSIEYLLINEQLTTEFDNYMYKLKPFILTQRIHDIDDISNQKHHASICNKIKIILCNELTFKVNDYIYELYDYEYINRENNTYYIKINSYDSLTKLRRNIFFTHSFADIISLSFGVSTERNEYKYILRGNLEDLKLSIVEEFGNDNYLEARNLLGFSDPKQAFWEAIFSLKGLEYYEILDDITLEKKTKKELNIMFDISRLDYENINRKEEMIKVQSLFIDLKINISEFNKYFSSDLSYKDIHYDMIKTEILKLKPNLKYSLWNSLKKAKISQKKSFLGLLNNIENHDKYVEELSSNHEFELYIDTQALALKFLDECYGNLDYDYSANLYPILKKNSLLFTVEEIDIINSSTEYKSLLYFEDCLKELKEFIKHNENTDKFEHKNIELVHDRNIILKPTINSNRSNNKPGGVYLPSSNESIRKKQKGDTIEELVFNYMLKNKFNNVDWISRDNEGLHCDIRYIGNDQKIKYVEVKAFDNNSFYLSREEYDFGKKEKENYEIWLVKDYSKIIVLEDFFENSVYNEAVEVNHYKVYLEPSML